MHEIRIFTATEIMVVNGIVSLLNHSDRFTVLFYPQAVSCLKYFVYSGVFTRRYANNKAHKNTSSWKEGKLYEK